MKDTKHSNAQNTRELSNVSITAGVSDTFDGQMTSNHRESARIRSQHQHGMSRPMAVVALLVISTGITSSVSMLRNMGNSNDNPALTPVSRKASSASPIPIVPGNVSPTTVNNSSTPVQNPQPTLDPANDPSKSWMERKWESAKNVLLKTFAPKNKKARTAEQVETQEKVAKEKLKSGIDKYLKLFGVKDGKKAQLLAEGNTIVLENVSRKYTIDGRTVRASFRKIEIKLAESQTSNPDQQIFSYEVTASGMVAPGLGKTDNYPAKFGVIVAKGSDEGEIGYEKVGTHSSLRYRN